MDDLFKAIVASGQCGLATFIVTVGLIYQTWRIVKIEALREVDRVQIIADAEARTKAALANQEATAALVKIQQDLIAQIKGGRGPRTRS